MKTYKQRLIEAESLIRVLSGNLHILREENQQRKIVMKDQNLFDPIEYMKVYKKLQTCIGGLETINSLEKQVRLTKPEGQMQSKTFSEIISEEVLREVK